MSLEGWTDIMSARRRPPQPWPYWLRLLAWKRTRTRRGRYAFERTNGSAVAALYFLAVIGVCGIILLNLTLAGA